MSLYHNPILEPNERVSRTTMFPGWIPDDGEEVKNHINLFLESVERLEKVVTASSIVEDRLIKWGVPSEKLVKIPLGVNTKKFIPTS